MITELDKLLAPEWLATVSEESRLPSMDQLLRDSLYYPASGLNGTPVKFLAGNVYSFIYADYGVDRTAFLDNLNGTDPECGFRHYHSMCQRDVFREDIVPNDWRPPITPTEHGDRQRLEERERACRLFGHWSVWQRDATASTAVGPERFSFLFLAGEMSAIYQGLYSRMGIAPRILAIIQPGTMGGEWESVTSDESFFKKVVRGNTAGLPEFLLYGGFGQGGYEEACWIEYRGERLVQLPERYAGLWRLN